MNILLVIIDRILFFRYLKMFVYIAILRLLDIKMLRYYLVATLLLLTLIF
jgi:hypothetical protein